MSVLWLSESSPGAPTLNGVNGALCTVLDWALVQAGWAIEYTATNARVYRPGTGNRYRLHVNHDSTVSGDARAALIRGCENASSATSLTDPFPLTTQVANASSNWQVSSTASATARPYRILLTETFVCLFTNINGGAAWEVGMFGDMVPSISTDTYCTVCVVRNVSTYTSSSLLASTGNTVAVGLAQTSAYVPKIFFTRDITGVTKSTNGFFYASTAQLLGGGGFGNVTGCQPALGGYGSRIYREYMGVSCRATQSDTGSTTGTTGLIKRGWVPNIWNPIHNGSGGTASLDTFQDLTYDPTASFTIITSASGTATAPFLIAETTDTWNPP